MFFFPILRNWKILKWLSYNISCSNTIIFLNFLKLQKRLFLYKKCKTVNYNEWNPPRTLSLKQSSANKKKEHAVKGDINSSSQESVKHCRWCTYALTTKREHRTVDTTLVQARKAQYIYTLLNFIQSSFQLPPHRFSYLPARSFKRADT